MVGTVSTEWWVQSVLNSGCQYSVSGYSTQYSALSTQYSELSTQGLVFGFQLFVVGAVTSPRFQSIVGVVT